ncbi:MAG: hypothetical protein A3E83_05595 [Gammaproteobacteria bacterium RIFCSPHIGHO2_12_FULL_41_20]|nr:MAG: hypothetical protein A3E83_05595 [Gammaproteobacteria bacterium RIFCSPHIGHO2_12_FULL_41_20]
MNQLNNTFSTWLHIAMLVTVSLSFTACVTTSPKMAEELQLGKRNFEAGYYKRAFQTLLPLAAAGKAEAEYAVGYMYYYGYGVAQDTDTGRFWINKAAEQKYPPAIKALQLMDQQANPAYRAKQQMELITPGVT